MYCKCINTYDGHDTVLPLSSSTVLIFDQLLNLLVFYPESGLFQRILS